MATGRRRDEWDRTAQILATLINVNRDPKSDPVDARDLHPYREVETIPHVADVSALKGIFKL